MKEFPLFPLFHFPLLKFFLISLYKLFISRITIILLLDGINAFLFAINSNPMAVLIQF